MLGYNLWLQKLNLQHRNRPKANCLDKTILHSLLSKLSSTNSLFFLRLLSMAPISDLQYQVAYLTLILQIIQAFFLPEAIFLFGLGVGISTAVFTSKLDSFAVMLTIWNNSCTMIFFNNSVKILLIEWNTSLHIFLDCSFCKFKSRFFIIHIIFT